MKFIKSKLFLVLITAIIVGSVGVYAGTKINANDISYDSTHTVKDKIDDLYTKTSTCKNLTENTDVTSNKMLLNTKAYNKNGELITGSIETYSVNGSITPTTSQQTLATAGKYLNSDITIGAAPDVAALETELSKYSTLKQQLDNYVGSLNSTTSSINIYSMKYKYFRLSNLTKDNNVNVCKAQSWSNQQSSNVDLSMNTDYQVYSNTDGYKFSAIRLYATAKANGTWGSCTVTIEFHN